MKQTAHPETSFRVSAPPVSGPPQPVPGAADGDRFVCVGDRFEKGEVRGWRRRGELIMRLPRAGSALRARACATAVERCVTQAVHADAARQSAVDRRLHEIGIK